MNILEKILLKFLRGSERSVKAKLNIIYMLFIKGGSILVGLLLVPLTLDYVDSSTYGIWITLSSMIAWISFFDVGLNNGLKNKLVEAIAANNLSLGRKYVSTTYALLVLIFLPLMIILLLVVPFINWQSLLNIDCGNEKDLLLSVFVLIIYFCSTFILSTINVVMNAYQRPAQAALRGLIQQLASLFLIYIFIHTTEGSLFKLCLALCIAPLFVITLFNLTLYRSDYKEVSPSIRSVDFSLLPDLLKLGFQFFVIQIAGIIQFQMVNFLIIRNYGPEDVTAYNIANKYFSVLYMIWGILISPLWAAVTDAMAKGDIQWIINARQKYLRILLLFVFLGVIMLISSTYIYSVWVGSSVHIEWSLSFFVFLYNLVMMLGSIYVMILNGLGQLKIQTFACIFSPIVFCVSVYILTNLGHGVYSILLASILANFNGFILAPLQLRHFLRK